MSGNRYEWWGRMQRAVEAVEAAQAAPAGYVLVPVDPTPEMLDALRTGSRKDWPSDELVRVRWAAMLAAALKAPAALETPSIDAESAANFVRAREWAQRYGRLEIAAEHAAEALEEAQSYTSCESWSPSMTAQCERAAKRLRDALAPDANAAAAPKAPAQAPAEAHELTDELVSRAIAAWFAYTPEKQDDHLTRMHNALRVALAANMQPKGTQKPVAWMYTSKLTGDQRYITRYQADLDTYKADKVWPLYDHPAQAPAPVDEEPTAFVHWPLNGPPRLVWYSNKALHDAIERGNKAQNGYVPDLKLYAHAPCAAVGADDEQDAAKYRHWRDRAEVLCPVLRYESPAWIDAYLAGLLVEHDAAQPPVQGSGS